MGHLPELLGCFSPVRFVNIQDVGLATAVQTAPDTRDCSRISYLSIRSLLHAGSIPYCFIINIEAQKRQYCLFFLLGLSKGVGTNLGTLQRLIDHNCVRHSTYSRC